MRILLLLTPILPGLVLVFSQRGLFGLVAGLTKWPQVLTFEKVVALLAGFYNGVVKRAWGSMAAPVRSKWTHGPGIHALKGSHNVIQSYFLGSSGQLVAARGAGDASGQPMLGKRGQQLGHHRTRQITRIGDLRCTHASSVFAISFRQIGGSGDGLLGEFSDFEHGYDKTSLLCAVRHRELGLKLGEVKIDAAFRMIGWRLILVEDVTSLLRNNYSAIEHTHEQTRHYRTP